MVKEPRSKEPKNAEVAEQVINQFKQEPKFTKLQDKKVGEPEQVKITPQEEEEITKACPHYYILRNRYSEYKKTDEEGKNPIPLRIDRIHELSAFEATIAQADLEKGLTVTPTRLIKLFDYSKSNERKPFLIIDKRVVGIDKLGRSTNISTVRTGRFKFPTQFEEDVNEGWVPVTNKFETHYTIPFSKEEVEKYANVGNPYTKKYVVWHPDGMRRGHFTRDEFINLTDDEQISLIEKGER
jgi:hypothetical protein